MAMIHNILTSPRMMLIFLIGISVFSLGAAFTAQYGFGLEPCVLCLYQRIPFAVAAGLGVLGLTRPRWAHSMIGLSAIAFDLNGLIAFYHSGVERKWWASFLEGCAVPDLGDDPAAILEKLMSTPAVRCDEIPWADPILGLSMANYNVALCFGLAGLSALSWIMIRRAHQK